MITVDVCSADIPLHIGIRQTSDDGSPIVISQPGSSQVSSAFRDTMIQVSATLW